MKAAICSNRCQVDQLVPWQKTNVANRGTSRLLAKPKLRRYNGCDGENDMASDTGSTAQQLGRRVYLDVCALNRPLDDQDQLRIRLEADAVQLILSYVRSQELVLVISPAHRVEISANPDPARRQHMESLIAEIGTDSNLDAGQARRRAESLLNKGLKPADAAHAALAEEAGCDFVTVDDRLLRQLQRAAMTVWCGNPVAYCEKVGLK